MTPDPCQQLVNAATQQAAQAARILNVLPGKQRTAAVQAMAKQLQAQQDDILEANTLDLEISREMAVPDRLLDWLRLTPERLQNVVNNLIALSDLPDPIGRVTTTGISLEQGQAYFRLMPLGVVAFVHESLPDLGALMAGLCVRTGNSLILRGGQEAVQTNRAIVTALQTAITSVGLPVDSLVYLSAEADCSLRDLLTQDQLINLVIPYGRPSWVEQVVRQCTGPVLRSAIGNCALYWSSSGNWNIVQTMIVESHSTLPDAVNAIEKVLIPPDYNRSTLMMLWQSLREQGFELRGDERLATEFPELLPVADEEWNQSYLRRIVAFKQVDGFRSAIDWINQYSSGHADCLVTESYQESQQFALGIDSASVYINASPRFYRLSRRGDAVFLGISNQKGMRRGHIGLESLMTMKQVVQGFELINQQHP
jgi:glutamate-5-semialdehyde dehydrogenase